MKTWQAILLGMGVAVAVLLAFVLGRHWPLKPPISPIEERVDTLVVRDTITAYEPKYITRRVVDSVAVPVLDTVRLHDTLFVYLEREQIRWEDSLAVVYASGVQPKVDSVIHFTSQMVITDVKVVEKIRKTRWGVGVQVGGGAVIANGRVAAAPYVGVGISYNIVAW